MAIFLFSPTHITTNMLSIFKSDENIEKLKTVNSFENASTLFVSIKGFNKENREKLIEIEKRLKTLPYIKETKLNISKIGISDYLKQNYFLLSDFKPIPLEDESIKKRVTELKRNLLNSFIYQPIDKNDPFKLFEFNPFSGEKLSKNGFLKLGEYGYLLTAKIDGKISDMKRSQKIEQELSELFKSDFFKDDRDTLLFSSLFFTAQNSKIIKANVHTILYLSFGLLLLLFFITLRDHKLLIANSLTLASSVFVALSFSTYIFQEVSIFTLAFGSAISSISVDYLFHNYFHKEYLKKGVNRSILIAFLTTLLGFVLLSFVDFPLISQLSIFAMVSLSFSYFQFTFLYPRFQFLPKENRLNLSWLTKTAKVIPINAIFIFSLLSIGYSTFNIKFDYNLKNLDYQNIELQAKQKIIQENFPQKTTLLLEAKSIDRLIEKAIHLKENFSSANSIANLALSQKEFSIKSQKIKEFDFKKLKNLLEKNAKLLKFKEGYFHNAYAFVETIPKRYQADIDLLKKLGYEVIKVDEYFYTLATLDKNQPIKEEMLQEGVYIIDGLKLIKKTTKTMFESLIFYMIVASLAIIGIIIFFIREKTILALNFILFPIAIILLYLSFSGINIMHLFSIIIIIVAGIDYGIYMSQENSKNSSLATMEAIFYSLLTSFSGFGILILSSIGAIHSIGVVITIGILAILFLVLFLKTQTS